ncbi:hypothetical protein [Maricaulis sp.]|uniref:hypothetical protein n=1 Tax=Maricaulis sp. TaxID=1486257 RepID=UPI003A8D9A20
MGIDIVVLAVSAIATLLGGRVVSSALVQKIIRTLFRIPEEPSESYADKVGRLTHQLNELSGHVDEVLREISTVTIEKQKRVEYLEESLANLEGKEKEIKEKIVALEKTPVESAKIFADLVTDGEKRGRNRDYVLFGVGVLVTTGVALLIQLFL